MKVVSRRGFLKGIAAASVSGPQLITAQKSRESLPVVGEGEHLFEVIHDWPRLPEGMVWETTQDIAVSHDGLVFIIHNGKRRQEPRDTVFVFDPEGKFIRSFGKELDGGGHGLDIRMEDGQEFVYLCDRKNRNLIFKSTLEGEILWEQGLPEACPFYGAKDAFLPTNVAFAPDGGFYVADGYGSFYIHQFGRDVDYMQSWGGKGDRPGKMNTPHGLWVDTRDVDKPELIVADRVNHRLQRFTLDGRYVGQITDSLSLPANVDIKGDLMLVPNLNGSVVLFNAQNDVAAILGDNTETMIADTRNRIRSNPSLWEPGKWVHPHDACFDNEGNIFVCEWVATGRISKLRRV